jgi:hypothetical protein
MVVTAGSHPGVGLLDDEAFVWRSVWPFVSPGGDKEPPGSEFALTMHRSREDGRAVAEYSFEGAIRVFAKVYPEADAGRATYRILRSLWTQGFGAGSFYRVPEPIGYLAEPGVLLTRPAPGRALGGLETREREPFEQGTMRAAQWLAALHTSPTRLGPPRNVALGVFRLGRRAKKAVACRPDLEDVFRRSIQELERRFEPAAEPRTHVQTHGRYCAQHVFLDPAYVTVVDLDRAAVADPAKDVGEFLHHLRWEAAKAGIGDEAIDGACEAFLGEYARHSPAALTGLTYHWSYSILWSVLGLAFRLRPARTAWNARSGFLRAEFDDVPRRVAVWLGHP